MAKNDDMSAYERAMLEETRAHNARMQELAALSAAPPKSFVDQGADRQFDALKATRHTPGPEPTRVPLCQSVTGASFTAIIDHNGNTIRLEDYAHPTGTESKVTEGGLVPQGFEIGRERHQQWKWEMFWQADINAFVGKPLPAHVRDQAERASSSKAAE